MTEAAYASRLPAARASYATIADSSTFGKADGFRTRLVESDLVVVDNLSRPESAHDLPAVDYYSTSFKVCLPYRGAFVWHVGGEDVVCDPNQVLFLPSGERFGVSDPRRTGFGELIIAPESELLLELVRSSEQELPGHPLFRGRSREADFPLQAMRARYLHRATSGDWGDEEAEEMTIALIRRAFMGRWTDGDPSASTRRLLAVAKLFLAEHFMRQVRLSDVARAAGASPAYLTEVFRRVEGVTLHRYIVRLRLAAALAELPHTSDLSALAIEVGFASHSHFTSTFRRAFGCTPSEFRSSYGVREHRRRARTLLQSISGPSR